MEAGWHVGGITKGKQRKLILTYKYHPLLNKI